MKTKITLRPLTYGNGNLRLGLFTEDFNKYVKNNKVQNLFIDLGQGYKDVVYKKTYIKKGSLLDKALISDWLHQNGFTNNKCLLDFELDIDMATNTHLYRLL